MKKEPRVTPILEPDWVKTLDEYVKLKGNARESH